VRRISIVRFLGFFLLLIAASAQGQFVVTDEVIWRKASTAATYRPAPQAAPVAADEGGFMVAWSEFEEGLSRAYAGRLDTGGHLVTVGVRTGGAADAPSIAAFGDRLLVAWLEPDAYDGRPMLVTGALDHDFKLLSARPIGLTLSAPVVRAASSRAYVGSGKFAYEVDAAGAPLAVFDLPRAIDDIAIAGSQVGYVWHASGTSASLCSWCQPHPPPAPTPTYVLTFTWQYKLIVQTALPFKSDAPAAISSNGNEFLVVWSEAAPNRSIKASLFGSTFKPFLVSARGPLRFDSVTQPQVAWDGMRWVAVWALDDSIEGAVIAADLKVTPFTVSARGLRPAIAAAKPGRFIVTYEVVDPTERRLASRLIDFGPRGDRERAVR
jgi:hypothetical protein